MNLNYRINDQNIDIMALLNIPIKLNDELLREIGRKNLCVGCLSVNVPLVNLTTCKHSSFFQYFFDIRMEYVDAVVCYLCHNFLRKIEIFKQQVQESLSILNNQALHAETKMKHNILQICALDYNTITESDIDIKDEIPDEEPIYDDVTTEVKIERDSDFENDVPLAQIKKKMPKPKKVCQRRSTKKFEGKIMTVTLTKEEMFQDRERDAQKEAYLKLPYKCTSCIIGFDHEATLNDHMEKRHTEKKGGHICDICKSVLSSITSYREHSKRHLRRFECVECGKRNNDIYSVVKHYNEQHGKIITQFTCEECGFNTESHRSYRYHKDKHKEKQKCTLCGNTFVNKAALKMHMFTVHKQSSRIYSCEACNKVYNAKSGLLAHVTSVHGGNVAYCAPCRTHFRTELNLKHHLKTNSRHVKDTDKRFTCDSCDAKFMKKSSLQDHIDWVHLNRTKYGCHKCSKVFKTSTSLKRHKSFVHEKKRPPRDKICDHCGRGFTTLSILRSHIRTHTGERPLHCSRCPATFAHSAALYTHNKLLHTSRPEA